MSRRITAGSSRAWVNGRPVTAGALAELGELLVAVHGQHAHHRLLTPSAARDVVDQLCSGERSAYAGAWARWRAAVEERKFRARLRPWKNRLLGRYAEYVRAPWAGPPGSEK